MSIQRTVNNKKNDILSPIINEIIVTTTRFMKVTTKIKKIIIDQIFLSQRKKCLV